MAPQQPSSNSKSNRDYKLKGKASRPRLIHEEDESDQDRRLHKDIHKFLKIMRNTINPLDRMSVDKHYDNFKKTISPHITIAKSKYHARPNRETIKKSNIVVAAVVGLIKTISGFIAPNRNNEYTDDNHTGHGFNRAFIRHQIVAAGQYLAALESYHDKCYKSYFEPLYWLGVKMGLGSITVKTTKHIERLKAIQQTYNTSNERIEKYYLVKRGDESYGGKRHYTLVQGGSTSHLKHQDTNLDQKLKEHLGKNHSVKVKYNSYKSNLLSATDH